MQDQIKINERVYFFQHFFFTLYVTTFMISWRLGVYTLTSWDQDMNGDFSLFFLSIECVISQTWNVRKIPKLLVHGSRIQHFQHVPPCDASQTTWSV